MDDDQVAVGQADGIDQVFAFKSSAPLLDGFNDLASDVVAMFQIQCAGTVCDRWFNLC